MPSGPKLQIANRQQIRVELRQTLVSEARANLKATSDAPHTTESGAEPAPTATLPTPTSSRQMSAMRWHHVNTNHLNPLTEASPKTFGEVDKVLKTRLQEVYGGGRAQTYRPPKKAAMRDRRREAEDLSMSP
jgi:hypothetical protein